MDIKNKVGLCGLDPSDSGQISAVGSYKQDSERSYINQLLLPLLLATYLLYLAKLVSAPWTHHQWLCIYTFGSNI
jgi:hypothetical protein